MKTRALIAGSCFAWATFVFPGCSENPNRVLNENRVQAVVTETPSFRIDGRGNRIKDDGWEIPLFIVKTKGQSSRLAVNEGGQKIRVFSSQFTPENKIPGPGPALVGDQLEWLITSVTELTGKDRKIFCYEFASNPVAKNPGVNGVAWAALTYRFCDYDGDGKFESQVEGLKPLVVPNWVK
jgi:hypothetical protein